MPREDRLFELGRYWIGGVPGSANLYRFWYDEGARDVRRRSLETPDLEAAKTALAAIFIKEGDPKAREPQDVSILAVLTSYWENHSDLRSNPFAARRSGNLLLDFLGDNAAKVSILTKQKQVDFIKSLRARGLSVAYITRIQTVIAAAGDRRL